MTICKFYKTESTFQSIRHELYRYRALDAVSYFCMNFFFFFNLGYWQPHSSILPTLRQAPRENKCCNLSKCQPEAWTPKILERISKRPKPLHLFLHYLGLGTVFQIPSRSFYSLTSIGHSLWLWHDICMPEMIMEPPCLKNWDVIQTVHIICIYLLILIFQSAYASAKASSFKL